MAYCTNCGAQSPDGTPNCPTCGASIHTGAGDQDAQANKVMAILAYILFLIPLLGAKDSPFARYHTNQGLVMFLTSIINCIIALIPIIGWIVAPIISIGIFALMIIGIINAAKGERKPLPLIGGITLLK